MLCFALLLTAPAAVARHLDSLQSQITVNRDGTLTVHEIIRWRTEQNLDPFPPIERRIPTHFATPDGQEIAAWLQIKSVKHNGLATQFDTKSYRTYLRLHIKAKNNLLSVGTQRFDIIYTVKNALVHSNDKDYLHWIANGYFTTDTYANVSVRVKTAVTAMPSQASITLATEPLPANEKSAAQISKQGVVTASNQQAAGYYRPLAINIWWPRGTLLAPMSRWQTFKALITQPQLTTVIVSLLLLTVYYCLAWLLLGRDPSKGHIELSRSPPGGVSPASIHYLAHMGFSVLEGKARALAATLIQLAVNRHIRIYKHNTTFILKRLINQASPVYPLEREILQILFQDSDVVPLRGVNWEHIADAMVLMQQRLTEKYLGEYFVTNTRYFVMGVVLSIFTLFLWIWVFPGDPLESMGTVALLCYLLTLNSAFYFLLKAPTTNGRHLLDKIDGFRQYLINPRKLDSAIDEEQFERCLPYAIAMGVGHAWVQAFKDSGYHDNHARFFYFGLPEQKVHQLATVPIAVAHRELNHRLTHAIASAMADSEITWEWQRRE